MGRFSELRKKAKSKKVEGKEEKENKKKEHIEKSTEKKEEVASYRKENKKIVLPSYGLAEDVLSMFESGEPVTVAEEPGDELRNVVAFEEALIQLVIFTIGEEVYGVDIYYVKEIINPVEIIRVPKTHNSLKGVINLRGNVVPVFDLRVMFNMPSADNKSGLEKFVVIEVSNHLVAFMVDRIHSVSKVQIEEIEPAPPQLRLGISSEFISGLAKVDEQVVAIIEIDKLVKSIKAKGGKKYG